MKRSLLTLSLLSLALLAPACPPAPQPPDGGKDAGLDGSVSIYDAACTNLVAIGCADGRAPNCAVELEQMVTDRRSNVNVQCIVGAKSPAAVRACGPVCR